jgi:hypothetical protein
MTVLLSLTFTMDNEPSYPRRDQGELHLRPSLALCHQHQQGWRTYGLRRQIPAGTATARMLIGAVNGGIWKGLEVRYSGKMENRDPQEKRNSVFSPSSDGREAMVETALSRRGTCLQRYNPFLGFYVNNRIAIGNRDLIQGVYVNIWIAIINRILFRGFCVNFGLAVGGFLQQRIPANSPPPPPLPVSGSHNRLVLKPPPLYALQA